MDLFHSDPLQTLFYIVAENFAHLRTMGFRNYPSQQVGCSDRVGLIKKRYFPLVESVRRHPERKREQKRKQAEHGTNHRADRRLLFFFGAMFVHSPLETALNGEQDEQQSCNKNTQYRDIGKWSIARHLNRRLHIIVRTRFREEITPLMDLGANEVIPEEFEASVEIFSRILSRYLLPEDEIHRFVDEIRSDGYAMFRNLSKHATSCPNIGACMPDMDLRSLRVHKSSPLSGKTIGEAKLGSQYGVTVLAVRRDAEIFSIPQADLELRPEDILFIVGPPEKITDLETLLRGEK